MKSVFVYCEVEDKKVAEISQELLSAGKRLAQKLGCPLEAMIFGGGLNNIATQISPFGVSSMLLLITNEVLFSSKLFTLNGESFNSNLVQFVPS